MTLGWEEDEMEMPNKEQIVEWHGVIMSHAKANYNNGWDSYVECFGADDLARLIEDKIEWNKKWDATLESVMKELEETFKVWRDRDEDMMAEACSHQINVW